MPGVAEMMDAAANQARFDEEIPLEPLILDGQGHEAVRFACDFVALRRESQ